MCVGSRVLVVCCLLMLTVVSPALAADATPHECRWAHTPPVIDGLPDDAIWREAQLLDQFALPWLGQAARPAKTFTKARLLWNREALFFTAELEDHDLFADITEHDGQTWDNDVFELFFKPSPQHSGYYEFQVNAAGTIFDAYFPTRSSEKFDEVKRQGNFRIVSKVRLNGTLNARTDRDTGWTVEGKIPWSAWLRTGGRPEPGEVWNYALCRYDFTQNQEPELSSNAPLAKLSFHQHEDYLPLKFIGPNAPATMQRLGLEYAPLTTSRVTGSPDPLPPYRTVNAFPQLKLSSPLAVTNVPGSDWLLLIDQNQASAPSRICRLKDDPATDTLEELILHPDETAYGIAFHPQFAQNGLIYVGCNGPGSAGFTGKTTRVVRYHLQLPECKIDPASRKIIIEWESDGHNGGDVTFGTDGLLYITSGDGTSDSDTNVTGQDLTKLLAKVLRIDVDHPTETQAYSVPADNPFLQQANTRPETWAYGFRNPWRMTSDPRTGHIWVGNNGQDLWEQVYFVRPRANFGWSVTEGSHPFYLDRKLGPQPLSLPIAEHPHSDARSLTGGVVYYGNKFPELHGAYIYGDYSTGKIWGIKVGAVPPHTDLTLPPPLPPVEWNKLLADTTFAISGFGLDAHGEVLILDHRAKDAGGAYHFEPQPPVVNPTPFPRRLSDTGLFASVKGHAVQPGVVPYSVNASLWSDGTQKTRFIAIPHVEGEDRRIELTRKNGWNFPNGTVLVKSFAMPGADPAAGPWIETRLMTRQEGEWVGYSYQWNAEQTEAHLVETAGTDHEYTYNTPQGPQKLAWHFPSRAECMVCHSRAANYVLGLTELQFNKVHHYPQGALPQLELLEALGLLKVAQTAEVKQNLKAELEAAGLTGADLQAELDLLSSTNGQRGVPGHSTLLALPPQQYKKLVDPLDTQQPVALRAKSYLHANCAVCHVEAGGGNAQFDIDFDAPPEKAKLLDVKPVHNSFGIADARLIAPGAPERSILLQRISKRGTGTGQMPQLGTNQIDQAAVDLITAWIRELPGQK